MIRRPPRSTRTDTLFPYTTLFRSADLVVIPFRKATNSGSVALALSFARPVAVPDIPVFREVRDIVGSDWLYLFPGELDAAGLERIIAWARTTPRAAEPDLGELDWERIAERTMDFFHAVRGGRSEEHTSELQSLMRSS